VPLHDIPYFCNDFVAIRAVWFQSIKGSPQGVENVRGSWFVVRAPSSRYTTTQ
jgi:hypothetical protein